MDCLNLYEENIESFPAVSTPYHNEVIVWWCILFMIFEAHFFPSVLGINELLFPSHVGCDWISRAVRSPSFSSAWRNVLIFVLSKIILTWSRRRSVWNDNIRPPPCVADAITDSQLHGDQWMPLFFGCWFFSPRSVLWAFNFHKANQDPVILWSTSALCCQVSLTFIALSQFVFWSQVK